MRVKAGFSLCAAMLLSLLSHAPFASRCDAHYPGTLTDATDDGYDGYDGYDGMMISESGPAKPQFGEGKYGQALHITGGAAMRALLFVATTR